MFKKLVNCDFFYFNCWIILVGILVINVLLGMLWVMIVLVVIIILLLIVMLGVIIVFFLI